MILSCSCEHSYQDEHYGKGRRVHNVCIRDRVVSHRCTVCGNKRESRKERIFLPTEKDKDIKGEHGKYNVRA